MKRIAFSLITCLASFSLQAASDTPTTTSEQTIIDCFIQTANEPNGSIFSPPENWRLINPNTLPKHVKLMTIGKSKKNFSPTINLATEKYDGTLKDYLKIVKEINKSKGGEWKNLGTVKTQAGTASLSQAEGRTQWGDTKLMHVILLHKGTIHIVTAVALKEEFPAFYEEFFSAMKSFRINPCPEEMITNLERKKALEEARQQVINEWKTTCQTVGVTVEKADSNRKKAIDTFNSKTFQEASWKVYQKNISDSFDDMSDDWKNALFHSTRHDLISIR